MIIWVRHGESTWNARGKTQGRTPHPPLTGRGRRQAYALAGALGRAREQGMFAAWSETALYSSPAVRAAQTARILGPALSAMILVDSRLIERGTDEDPEQVRLRIRRFVADLPGSGVTFIVSHGDTIMSATGSLIDPLNNPLPNCGMVVTDRSLSCGKALTDPLSLIELICDPRKAV